MFLIGEYEWRKQMDIINPRRNITYRPTKEEFVTDAKKWLIELFDGESYDYESRAIFKCFPNTINYFIRYELFTNSSIIKIIFPKGMKDEERTKYRFVTVAFLFHQHYQHYLQREIDLLRDNNLIEHIENFLATLVEEFPEHQAYTYIQFDGKSYDKYKAIRLLPAILLETLEKTSFVFIDDPRHPHVYNFPKYQEGNFQCVQVKLQVVNYNDYEINTYSEYMQYLLTKERNGMDNFGKSLSFWKNHVGISRRNVDLADCAEPNKTLLIFSLALGMDDLVYDKLIDLRRGPIVERRLPNITLRDEKRLYEMLKDAHWFFEDARRQVNNPTEIPHRILENANAILIEERRTPILQPQKLKPCRQPET